jgi:predicted Zn-ribbon and HTH transcriptional regulator
MLTDRAKKTQAKRRRERVKAGRCRDCGRKRTEHDKKKSVSRCTACRVEARRYERDRRAAAKLRALQAAAKAREL